MTFPLNTTFLSSVTLNHSAPIRKFVSSSKSEFVPFYHQYPFNVLPQDEFVVQNTKKLILRTTNVDIADRKRGNSWLYYFMPLDATNQDVRVIDSRGLEHTDHLYENGQLVHGYKNSDEVLYFVEYDKTNDEKNRIELIRSIPIFSSENPFRGVQFEETETGFDAVLDRYGTYAYKYQGKYVVDAKFQNGHISIKSSTVKSRDQKNTTYSIIEKSIQFSWPHVGTVPRMTAGKLIAPNVIKVDAEIHPDFDVKVHQYDTEGNLVREILGPTILSIDGPYVHIRLNIEEETPVTVSFFAKQNYYMVPVPLTEVGDNTMLIYLRPRAWSAFIEDKDIDCKYQRVPHKLHYVVYDKDGMIIFASEFLPKQDGTDADIDPEPDVDGCVVAEYIGDTDLYEGLRSIQDYGCPFAEADHLILALFTNPTGLEFVSEFDGTRGEEIDFDRLEKEHFIQRLAASGQPLNAGGSYLVFRRPYTIFSEDDEYRAGGAKPIFYELQELR